MVGEQIGLFGQALLLGAALGLFYDGFRILRFALPCRAVTIALQDILYFLCAALATFWFFLKANSGELRGIVIIAEISGAMLWYFTLGRLVMGAARPIIRMVKKILRVLFRLFIRPILLLLLAIGRRCRRVWRFCIQKHKVAVKNAKFHLKRHKALVYNGKGNLGVSQNRLNDDTLGENFFDPQKETIRHGGSGKRKRKK